MLAPLGVQPRVCAEPCDVNDRQDPSFVAMVRPGAGTVRPRLYHIVPILDVLAGTSFVIVGRMAMRMHGLSCSVPVVEAVVSERPGPALWNRLSRRLNDGTMGIWSTATERYQWRPEEEAVAAIARETRKESTGTVELNFCTYETATELRVTVDPGPLPPHVIHASGPYDVPLLAVSELVATGDPEIGAAFRQLGARC